MSIGMKLKHVILYFWLSAARQGQIHPTENSCCSLIREAGGIIEMVDSTAFAAVDKNNREIARCRNVSEKLGNHFEAMRVSQCAAASRVEGYQ